MEHSVYIFEGQVFLEGYLKFPLNRSSTFLKWKVKNHGNIDQLNQHVKIVAIMLTRVKKAKTKVNAIK